MCEAGGLAERGQSVNDMSSHLWRVLALPLGVWEGSRDFSCSSCFQL